MGMRSSLTGEDITVIDYEGFKNMVIKFAEIEKNDAWLKAFNDKDRTVSFEFMDDWKIISYWYYNELLFFELCAHFIEGYVEFQSEEREIAIIRFDNGKTLYSISHFEEYNYNDLISDFGESDEEKSRREKLENLRVLYKI